MDTTHLSTSHLHIQNTQINLPLMTTYSDNSKIVFSHLGLIFNHLFVCPSEHNSFNVAPREQERCQLIKYSWLSDNTHTHLRCYRLSHLFSLYEGLAFSIIIHPVTGLPLERSAVNLLHNTSSNCTNFGSLFVACQCPSHFHFML
jgi:hypothetical protein